MDTTKGEEIAEVTRFPNRDLANMIEILKSVIQDDKDTNDRTKRDQGWTPKITSPPDIATWRVIYPIWRHFSSLPVKLDTVYVRGNAKKYFPSKNDEEILRKDVVS